MYQILEALGFSSAANKESGYKVSRIEPEDKSPALQVYLKWGVG